MKIYYNNNFSGKTTILFILIAIMGAGFTTSENSSSGSNNSPNKDIRYLPNDAYGFGEKLEYDVGYKFITAGTGYFYILPQPVIMNNRKCFDIRFQVRSLESLEWIYKVKDTYRTLLDVGGIFPWQFEQHVREGGYSRDYKAEFDQENNIAIVGNKKHKVRDYIHDIVSAFYYVRTLNIGAMPKDSIFYLSNFFDDTTNILGVKILGKQVAEVPAGKFKCTVIEPLVSKGGLFKSEGRILIWLTDDERKIPVKVATKIPIGYVTSELVAYSGTRGPVKAKIE